MNTARQLTAEASRIPALAKAAVLEVVPDAEVYLYGSRARGDFEEDSDWDFLVLTAERATREVKDAVGEALHQMSHKLCDEGLGWLCLSSVVHSREYWSRPIVQATPFHREVSRDRVRI